MDLTTAFMPGAQSLVTPRRRLRRARPGGSRTRRRAQPGPRTRGLGHRGRARRPDAPVLGRVPRRSGRRARRARPPRGRPPDHAVHPRGDPRTAGPTRPDRVIGHAVRWAQGFQLGWGDLPVTTAHPFGRTAGRAVFGHNGSNYCAAWADPDHGLVFAHLTNLITPRAEALRHQTEIADLVRGASCG